VSSMLYCYSLCYISLIAVYFIIVFRYGTLDDSLLTIDEDVKGSATGYFGVTLPLGGRQGFVAMDTLVVNEFAVEQQFSNTTVQWYSPKLQWDRAGVINIDSEFRVVDAIRWDAHGDFAYGDEEYAIQVINLNQSGLESFYCGGHGSYQASSFYQW
jgi:hypothetical protein